MLQIFPILLNMRKLDRSVHSFRILDFEVHQSTMSYTFVKLWKECPFEVGCDMPEQNSQIILTLPLFCIWICHKQIYSNCHYYWSGVLCALHMCILKPFSVEVLLTQAALKTWQGVTYLSKTISKCFNCHQQTLPNCHPLKWAKLNFFSIPAASSFRKTSWVCEECLVWVSHHTKLYYTKLY